jgi:uncharacterized protein YoxC
MNAAEERNVIPMPIADAQSHAAAAPQFAVVHEVTSPGNLEKVRDILFGSQMRDYDRRFARLEEKLMKETADAREDARRRFDSLEGFIKQEIAALGDRLRAENQQRSQSADDLTREMRDSSRSLTQKINQLDDQTAQANRELRQQILDQSKNLADDIRQKYDELSALLHREARELRVDKTDRAALANLFTELAMRLNNDFRLPGDE